MTDVTYCIYSCLPHQVSSVYLPYAYACMHAGRPPCRGRHLSWTNKWGPISCQIVIAAIFPPVCFSLSNWISAFDSFQTVIPNQNAVFQFVWISVNASLLHSFLMLSEAVQTQRVKLLAQNANVLIATARLPIYGPNCPLSMRGSHCQPAIANKHKHHHHTQMIK